MTLSRAEADLLARQGLDALRRGDGMAARAAFERMLADAPDAPRPWFPLAQACRLLDDAAGERAALEALLHDEPRHLAGLLLMGDRKQRDGDDRGATSFYTTALNQAAANTDVPASLHPLLQNAQAFTQAASARFADYLAAAVGSRPSPRVSASVDLLLGRTPLYLQQPSMFYFAGLPQRAFYTREDFGWAAALEAATPAIRSELASSLAARDDFRPYVEGRSDRPRPNNPLLDDPSWGALYLWRDGAIVADAAARFGTTMAALSDLPIPRIAGRSPMALFSRLTPGTHIRPHHGLLNTRLICHLPIVVPDGCALRVGADTHVWREGELVIFDDSIEHEAWNRGGGIRTVLLFEIWRPEIGDDERAELTCLFEAIDAYGPVDESDRVAS